MVGFCCQVVTLQTVHRKNKFYLYPSTLNNLMRLIRDTLVTGTPLKLKQKLTLFLCRVGVDFFRLQGYVPSPLISHSVGYFVALSRFSVPLIRLVFWGCAVPESGSLWVHNRAQRGRRDDTNQVTYPAILYY